MTAIPLSRLRIPLPRTPRVRHRSASPVPAVATGGRSHTPVCGGALLQAIARIDAERARERAGA